MKHLGREIETLNDDIVELMYLVKNQIEKDQKAFIEFDTELAHEIIANEKRVDTLELAIDRKCENILALHNPVAIDLRFVIACFKINSDLERLGDHANSIAKYILDFGDAIEEEIIHEMRLDEMFETAIQMFSNVFRSFIAEDTNIARKVFAKDETLNDINRTISKVTSDLIRKDPEHTQKYLYLFSIVRKLERAGDLAKNIAEEIIFYLEAKVLKHQKEEAKKNNNG